MSSKWTISSVYTLRKKVVKKTRAAHALNAVPNAMRHMEINEYGARVCEIWDTSDGTLYAVITAKLFRGKLHVAIVFHHPEVQA